MSDMRKLINVSRMLMENFQADEQPATEAPLEETSLEEASGKEIAELGKLVRELQANGFPEEFIHKEIMKVFQAPAVPLDNDGRLPVTPAQQQNAKDRHGVYASADAPAGAPLVELDLDGVVDFQPEKGGEEFATRGLSDPGAERDATDDTSGEEVDAAEWCDYNGQERLANTIRTTSDPRILALAMDRYRQKKAEIEGVDESITEAGAESFEMVSKRFLDANGSAYPQEQQDLEMLQQHFSDAGELPPGAGEDYDIHNWLSDKLSKNESKVAVTEGADIDIVRNLKKLFG